MKRILHRPRACLLLLPILLSVGSGCDLARLYAVLADAPREEVKPKFEGLAGKSLLIVVTCPEQIDFNYPMLRRDVADYIRQDIDRNANKPKVKKKVAFVEGARLRSYQEGNFYWAEMEPGRIGKALDADFVLWVDISEFNTRQEDAPDIFLGRLKADARLFDVASTERFAPVWSGSITARFPDGDKIGNNDLSDMRVRDETYRRFAERLGRNFYTWEREIR